MVRNLISTLGLRAFVLIKYLNLRSKFITIFVVLCLEDPLQDPVSNVVDEVYVVLGLLSYSIKWLHQLLLNNKNSLLEAIEHVLILLELRHSSLLCEYFSLNVLVDENK